MERRSQPCIRWLHLRSGSATFRLCDFPASLLTQFLHLQKRISYLPFAGLLGGWYIFKMQILIDKCQLLGNEPERKATSFIKLQRHTHDPGTKIQDWEAMQNQS